MEVPLVTDGVLNSFGDNYSNEVDGLDARKSANIWLKICLSEQQVNY